MQNNNADRNADTMQSVISDDLFPQVHHVSDVKQVLEEMTTKGQELQEWQVRAILFLRELGENEFLHPDGSPYKGVEDMIMQSKVHVVDPRYYIDTIESLIPKPPKPIVMAEKAGKGVR